MDYIIHPALLLPVNIILVPLCRFDAATYMDVTDTPW